MALIPKPKFPRIPQLPGVPQLLRAAVPANIALPVLGTGAALTQLGLALFATPRWGIFDLQGNQLVFPDSVIDFGFRNAYSLPTFPVQDGSFANYNKVSTPVDIVVRMSIGGSEAQRTEFIETLDRLAATTDLYRVLTPEKVYDGYNIERVEVIRRGTQGAFYIEGADVYLKEIRQITPRYENTDNSTVAAKVPEAVPAVNNGRVQTTQDKIAEAKAVLKRIDEFKRRNGIGGTGTGPL